MTKRIKTIGVKAQRIRSTSTPAALVDPQLAAKALGAERVMSMPTNLSPSVLLELRYQLFSTLKSRGGRPGLEGAELRPKIPMSMEDWHQLEVLAKELATDGFAPTEGQVGAQLLHAALAKIRGEAQPGSGSSPLAWRASEPVASYSPGSHSPHMGAQQAARRHLQQAQDVSNRRAARGASERRIVKLSIENLELIFTPPGLPVIDKGASSPTTSIAILGDAGAGKTTLAVALAHAIAADASGLALYVTTEIAPIEVKYKVSLLGVGARVLAWDDRAAAQAGDIIGQHVLLLEGADGDRSLIQRRALEAAWRLVDTTATEPPIRCVVIDAFPLPESSHSLARADIVTLIQALEGRGVSVLVVQEVVDVMDFVPFVADVVFQLTFDEDVDTRERVRRLSCSKSRYAHALMGPHDTGVDRGRMMVWPTSLVAEGRKRIGVSRR